MQDYRNGCRNAPGCPGSPTHVYRPSGGQPIAYCVSCMPQFLRARINELPTTEMVQQMAAATLDALAPAEEPEAPRRRRRSRKKSEDIVEETETVTETEDTVEDVVVDVEPDPSEPADEPVEEPTEE